MKIELDKALCAKYPEIFSLRYGDMSTTAMCWGFECGDGWYHIIDAACSQIQQHLNNQWRNVDWTIDHKNFQGEPLDDVPEKLPQVVAAQVKEKYGTLRFYTEGNDSYVDGVLAMAEAVSAVTCETCGAPGKRRGLFWIYTACDEHTRPEDRIFEDQEEESQEDMIDRSERLD